MTENLFTRDYAQKLDAQDELRTYRDAFHYPKTHNGQPCVYLCGNSLGLQPKQTEAYVQQELKDWQKLGVEGHFEAKNPWMPYHAFLTEAAAHIVGGKPIEVVTMNTLTVNLNLLMVSFYRPTKQRRKIVIEAHAFPSDQYAVKSQIAYHGFDPEADLIELTPREGEDTLRTEDVEALIEKEGETIALVLLGGVNYYTGQLFDIARITKAAHKAGAYMGVDLAHAAGNVPLHLHDWGVDFAAWCTYKYLNSGPGSVAGCFVHEKHAHNFDLPRFAGWWGHNQDTRFKMGPDFQPMPGAEGWQNSNPPILSLAAVKASYDLFYEVGMEKLRQKSLKLTGYLEDLLKQIDGVTVFTPENPDARGAQLSLRVRGGKEIFEHLSKNGVICDWREPDCIRVAPAPFYNSFEDVFQFAQILEKALKQSSQKEAS